jgi:hypothetical protein
MLSILIQQAPLHMSMSASLVKNKNKNKNKNKKDRREYGNKVLQKISCCDFEKR